jgi:hypothetical protein
MKKLMLAIILSLVSVTPAIASTVGRVDHSGLLVWMFLGFCALIVVAQLLPSVLMMLGIFNSFKETTSVTPSFKEK